ncbi:MAG: FHA domain-containing protein [Phycicoccus sp.]|nr:FHA domain-containing protein [Phycicoccus sp.]
MNGTTCPNGHVSASADYCDTCGAPMPASSSVASTAASAAPDSGSPSGPVPPPATPGAGAATAAATQPCPSCAMTNTAEALFCEACGYDFTTGTMPRSSTPPTGPAPSTNPLDLGAAPAGAPAPDPVAPAVKVEWVAEVWVDPDWYAGQESDEELPSPGLPVVVPLRARSLLIGRRSVSRNIHPDIECASDVGGSRRQAQLTTDGQRWWVEDLQSSNGTYVGAASGPLPEDAIPPGQRRELAQDDRIYLGAWTRIVVRRATPEEQAGQS